MSLATYITVQEAVQRFSLDRELLTTWINRGRIRGGRLNGTLVLIEEDARRVAELVTDAQSTRQQLRAEVAHLEGQPITVGMAARKYGLTTPSISRWAKAGYIRVIHQSGHGRPTLLDESDVAYAQKLVKLQEAGQGKRVFTAEYIPDWF